MSHELICAWMGLPAGEWPPDHYRLLGLEPGESNRELIEHRVHERMDAVRRYQMTHPEQATEAMNRLAQAFVCLTEPHAKQRYDEALFGRSLALAELPSESRRRTRVSPGDPTPLPTAARFPPAPRIDRRTPPPLPVVRPTPPPLPPNPGSGNTALATDTAVQLPPVPPPDPGTVPPIQPSSLPELAPAPPVPETASQESTETPLALKPAESEPPHEKIDPLRELARSRPARKGLYTRRAVTKRIAATRQLLEIWNELGEVIAPCRRLQKPQARQLHLLLEEAAAEVHRFPPILGRAGKPGFLVLSLNEHEGARTFQSLDEGQRAALKTDWENARRLLLEHGDFLDELLNELRNQTFRQRLRRAVSCAVRDQPWVAVLLLLLFAVNLVLWGAHLTEWWHHHHHYRPPANSHRALPGNPSP